MAFISHGRTADHTNATVVPIALACLALSAGSVAAEEGHPPVRVVRSQATVEVDNGLVKSCFALEGGRVKQRYYAARAGDWVLLAESYCPTDPLPGTVKDASEFKGPSQLYDTSADPDHRFLLSETLQTIGEVEANTDSAVIALHGKQRQTSFEQFVTLRRGQRFFHVEAKALLSGAPPMLEYLIVPFMATVDGECDAVHAPAYKPTADSVIGDRVFFAPVVCVQQAGHFVGLIPDLDIINDHVVHAKGARQHPDSNSFPLAIDPATVSMPTALDLEMPARVSKPILSYGMMDFAARQHVWFQHANAPQAMLRELSSGEVRIGMDLLLVADAPAHRGYQLAARHLWDRYGHDFFRRPRPQAMPQVEYAKAFYPPNFTYQGYTIKPGNMGITSTNLPNRSDLHAWHQWDVDGVPVGGMRLHAPQWSSFVANLGWWNNVCDATGLYLWGKQLNDAGLIDKARRMVNLALSAPQDRGLYPGLYDLRAKRWLRSLWKPPQTGYNPASKASYFDWSDGAAYQTAAASVTAGYLLYYRRNCEEDPRILPYVKRYGDFLLERLQPNGCVPGWFSADLEALQSLKWNADGGAHAWVLSELYLATKEAKYLEGAKVAGRFLLDEVLPQQRWVDFEAFYSCAVKPEVFFDKRTGQWPCNTMSVSWALQGFLALHEATRDRRYLDAAEASADFASLFQANWAPHYVTTAYPFGGMSSQLGDSEWLDQRAHRFADPFVRIGILTGRQDLVERGIAAARSNLTLTTHPLHQANDIYSQSDFPFGIGPENIDHDGFPQRPLASGPSWSSVGGLAGIAQVMRHLGGAFVDFEKDIAVGVDGVVITKHGRDGQRLLIEVENQLARLPQPWLEPFDIELRLLGLPKGRYELVLNGAAPVGITHDSASKHVMRIEGRQAYVR